MVLKTYKICCTRSDPWSAKFSILPPPVVRAWCLTENDTAIWLCSIYFITVGDQLAIWSRFYYLYFFTREAAWYSGEGIYRIGIQESWVLIPALHLTLGSLLHLSVPLSGRGDLSIVAGSPPKKMKIPISNQEHQTWPSDLQRLYQSRMLCLSAQPILANGQGEAIKHISQIQILFCSKIQPIIYVIR